MHAMFMTRGIKHAVDHLIMDMQAQKFPLKMKGPNGEERDILIQGQLRPIQLWEYIYPKEANDLVCSTLNMNQKVYPDNLKMKAFRAALAKAMGAKKPAYKEVNPLAWVNKDLQILPIGCKDDGELTEKSGDFKEWTHEAI